MKMTAAIPCYNGAAHIGRTIEALLAQSRPADQILVIDDGSTDGSAAIITRYPVELVIHEQNQGLSAARNTAIEHTRGDVLVYIDADAYADPQLLRVMEAEFSQGDPDGVGGQGIEAVKDSLYDRWRGLHASQSHGPRRLQRVDYLFGLCMGYRLEVIKQAGGFDPAFRTNAEDMEMGLRLKRAGRRLVYNPEARVDHQRRDDLFSLRRAMYNWYYWAFLAKRKNGYNPWRLALGTLRRLLISDTPIDLFRRVNPALVSLDLELSVIKLQAILAASRARRA